MIKKTKKSTSERMKGMGILMLVAFALVTFTSLQTQSKNIQMSASEIRDAYYESYNYESGQEYGNAIDALSLVYRANRGGYMVNLRLGWLHYLDGSYSDAADYYQGAIQAASSSIEAKNGYLLVLLALEKYEDAESVAYRILSDDRQNYYANLRLVYALRMQGKFDPAEDIALDMLDLYPTDVSFLTELALIYEWSGDSADAEDVFQEILMLSPENVTANQYLEN